VRDGVIAFLPWLNLGREIPFYGFTFAQVFPTPNRVHEVLQPIEARFLQLLDVFRDSKGNALRSGTFVFPASATWELSGSEMDEISHLLGPLLLACYSRNEYYSFAGSYVNSAAFALYSCVPTTPISFELRRRDGKLPHFGSPSGAFHFYMPSQCTGLGTAECDIDLIRSFSLALSKRAAVLDRIESALSFFEFANRDDAFMSMKNELVMMVAAYEHLLQPNALALSKSLAEHLKRFASGKTVGDARLEGRQVFKDLKDDTKLAAAPIHQGWIYELHKMRSAVVHPTTAVAKWGWTEYEHLLMGAFVFPLLVKVLLEKERLYVLSSDDVGRLKAIDELLIAREWSRTQENDGWAGIVCLAEMHAGLAQALSDETANSS
jgi:hypothetical protein